MVLTVDVTLDSDTAHPDLNLSSNRKQVTYGNTNQNIPDNPKKFSYYFMVLGKQGFSSGRFYFEVQVSGKTMWSLGVISESANRKEKVMMEPQNGFWTMGLRNGSECWVSTDPEILTSQGKIPEKVGVFVDYEDGLVSFYDVENRCHIYSYSDQLFTDKLYPFINPCSNEDGNNLAPLIISHVI